MRIKIYIVSAIILVACSNQVKKAKDQSEAIELAVQDDLIEIRKATKLVITPTSGQPVEIADLEEIKKVVGLLEARKETPTPGAEFARIGFLRNDENLRSIWVYHDGEWGVVRPAGSNYTLGRNEDLVKFINSKVELEQDGPSDTGAD